MAEEFGIDFLSPLVMLFIPPMTSVEASRSVVSTPQIISNNFCCHLKFSLSRLLPIYATFNFMSECRHSITIQVYVLMQVLRCIR